MSTAGPDPGTPEWVASWTIVVPVKGGPAAKSRLVVPGVSDHRALSEALALDTVAAATACPPTSKAASAVAALIVVTGDPVIAAATRDLGAVVVPDPGGGLNAAIEAGAAAAATAHPAHGTAALLGDLPALRPHDLAVALEKCANHRRAFVPDRQGTGTVLLAAQPGTPLRPAFGPASAARHAVVAARLDLDLPGLRTDVDDAAGLAAAAVCGLGSRTHAVLRAASRESATHTSATHESATHESVGRGSATHPSATHTSATHESVGRGSAHRNPASPVR